jgi:hypothetical protein
MRIIGASNIIVIALAATTVLPLHRPNNTNCPTGYNGTGG